MSFLAHSPAQSSDSTDTYSSNPLPPMGPVLNCPFCHRPIVVKSKRAGLREHMKLHHPQEYSKQNNESAVGTTEALEKSAAVVGTTLRNHTLAFSPLCPSCKTRVPVTNCSDFGLHVLACSGQLSAITDNMTGSKVVMSQFLGATPHVMPSILQQVVGVAQHRLAPLQASADEIDSTHVSVCGVLVKPADQRVNSYLAGDPPILVPQRAATRFVHTPRHN